MNLQLEIQFSYCNKFSKGYFAQKVKCIKPVYQRNPYESNLFCWICCEKRILGFKLKMKISLREFAKIRLLIPIYILYIFLHCYAIFSIITQLDIFMCLMNNIYYLNVMYCTYISRVGQSLQSESCTVHVYVYRGNKVNCDFLRLIRRQL